jgi:hypothetical protein
LTPTPIETREAPPIGVRVRTKVEWRGEDLVREGVVIDNTKRWYEGEGAVGGLTFDYEQDNGKISTMGVSSDAWEIIENEDEYPRCPKCGDPIDFCQGHGEIAEEMS